jgi:hypothetical protein
MSSAEAGGPPPVSSPCHPGLTHCGHLHIFLDGGKNKIYTARIAAINAGSVNFKQANPEEPSVRFSGESMRKLFKG